MLLNSLHLFRLTVVDLNDYKQHTNVNNDEHHNHDNDDEKS